MASSTENQVFQASRGRSEAKVARESPIVPILTVLRFVMFSYFLRTISWHLHKIFSLNAYISEFRRSIGTIFTKTWACGKDENCFGKIGRKFSANMIFFRNILKFGNLPTALIDYDELLPIFHQSNGLPSWIGSQGFSWLCRLFFGCRKLGEKNEEKWFSSGQLVLFSNFLDSWWRNSVPKPSHRRNNKNWRFWFFAETFRLFFRVSFGEIFWVFPASFGTSSRTFSLTRLYLWTQERYRCNFFVYFGASAGRNCFRKNRPEFLAAEKLAKKIESVFSEA